jgi:hypothetical protein
MSYFLSPATDNSFLPVLLYTVSTYLPVLIREAHRQLYLRLPALRFTSIDDQERVLLLTQNSSFLTRMTTINPFVTALMPISQTVAWFLVLTQSFDLFKSVSGISAFYCVWALVKRFIQGESKELGHISMGLLAVASFMEKKNFSIAATCLVLGNFALPAFFVFSWSAQELAHRVKQTKTPLDRGIQGSYGIIWARIFKAYFLSSICFWGFVLYQFIELPSDYRPVRVLLDELSMKK